MSCMFCRSVNLFCPRLMMFNLLTSDETQSSSGRELVFRLVFLRFCLWFPFGFYLWFLPLVFLRFCLWFPSGFPSVFPFGFASFFLFSKHRLFVPLNSVFFSLTGKNFFSDWENSFF